MSKKTWTEEGEAITSLILDVFKLNGRLLLAGDRLVSGYGLTSARWQVLGAIAYADKPESVAWLARNMGHHRQGVQRIVNELNKEGIIEFKSNPHHKRAHLVVLTEKGQTLFNNAMDQQIPWVNQLSEGLAKKDIETTKEIIQLLKTRLEAELDETK